ncbi:MAG TPA: PQQ-binding-like beta-propeller repeat protein, partial [Planctomycetota bacterium]|nr:PQQ-binding-like beta-propeller repeat protein [Planctomycetota bacterium]
KSEAHLKYVVSFAPFSGQTGMSAPPFTPPTLTSAFICVHLRFLLAVVCVSAAAAADWPQWGNTPDRNMVTDVKDLPVEWNPGTKNVETEEFDLATAKNVKWIAKLGSQTYGNTTVAGGKVFIGTNNTSPRNPKIAPNATGPQDNGDRGVMMVFDEATGKFLWQLTVPKLKSGKVNDWEFLGICSSPTVEGDRVYVVTNRCEILCLDVNGLANGNDGPFKSEGQYILDPDLLKGGKEIAAKPTHLTDADIIWRLDMMDQLGVFPHNASNCSVLIDGDLLYCCTSNGVDWGHVNVPAAQAPSFIAVNKKTGEVAWEDEIGMGAAVREDCGLTRAIFHGQWSNPSLGVVNNKKQVYFGGGDGFLYALDPETGKTIWKGDCVLPIHKKNQKGYILYPDAKGPSEINSTPVFYKNRVYVAVGQDPEHGEGVGVLTCWDATRTGDVTKDGKLWTYDKIQRSISTVSVYNGLVFICDFSGYIHCVDAETGAPYWVKDTRSHIWGSTLAGDGKVYFGNEDGDLIVIEAAKEYKELGKTNVGSAIYSTPIVANGVMYVASQTHLFAIQAQKK